MNTSLKTLIVSLLILNVNLTKASEPLEFQKLIFETEKLIPVIVEVEGVFDQNVQTIPFEYFQVAENLRGLDTLAKKERSLLPKVITFHERCALNERTSKIVRALCLTHYAEALKPTKKKIDWNRFPNDVKDLAKLIIED